MEKWESWGEVLVSASTHVTGKRGSNKELCGARFGSPYVSPGPQLRRKERASSFSLKFKIAPRLASVTLTQGRWEGNKSWGRRTGDNVS